ncbi:YpdA family putative bacillithiol disulfide reductase [Tuberibacillus sp. Marseille-P3662]|uniref:YpdA family putative bacillithiol disulfide reductase n=1 Tax=Tuberibacillus sp. Marseille-P3662 TaxID=1965358 RepID=UPI000A1CDEDC|nr:YpdA family putative bacillithiol disulfide reductase [Tuberibacillus sp. Marseille-P3662]
MVEREDVIIVGAGPCGLQTAIRLQEQGYRPLVIEKGNIVQTIYRYPTHQTFFSSSDKLEIGDMPFVIEEHKPRRNQALSYYREVVKRKHIRIHSFEEVTQVRNNSEGAYTVVTSDRDQLQQRYEARYVVIATGYYDHPNFMNIPGEELPKVYHYFKEPHPFFDSDVVVIGGKNSSVDTAMELNKAGARVTVIYRGSEYSESVKPWILPQFHSLVKNGYINMIFDANVIEIKPHTVTYQTKAGEVVCLDNDFVFAMTGYHPDHSFLQDMGIDIEDETGRPTFNGATMESNISGIFIAGVIAAGNNANEIFIENGRFHGNAIAKEIAKRDGKINDDR